MTAPKFGTSENLADECKDERSFELVIDPPLAVRLLDLNSHNRPLSQATVDRYVGEMLAGRWKSGPHCRVQVSRAGVLLNGQHTLWAIVESEKPQKLWVDLGCDPALFEVIDSGRPRSAGDLIGIEYQGAQRVVAVNKAAAVARRMLEGLATGGKADHRRTFHHYQAHRATIDEAIQVASGSPIYNGAWVAAFCNGALVHGRERVWPLLQRFSNQTWEGPGDPMRVLFQKFQRNALERGKGRRTYVFQAAIYGYTVAAIRCCLEGRTIANCQGTDYDFGSPEERRNLRLKKVS